MPDKMKPGGFDELITPINEEGNRSSNDPNTHNVPTETMPPDPLDLTHGIFVGTGGARKKEAPPPKGK